MTDFYGIGNQPIQQPPQVQQPQNQQIPTTKTQSPGGIYDNQLQQLGVTKGGKAASFVDSFLKGNNSVRNRSKPDGIRAAFSLYRQEQTQQALGNPVDKMRNDFAGFPGNVGVLCTNPSTNIDQEVNIQGPGRVAFKELERLVDAGQITAKEREIIEEIMGEFIDAYWTAFPGMPEDSVKQLALDNARKLAFQTVKDKQVFSGSDHGTLHIVQGNLAMARKMRAGLSGKNVNLTQKDWAILMQATIDHDMGYTTEAAQNSFNASKDHPLASALLVEQNSAYYDQYFGDDAGFHIRDLVLTHSYPRWDGIQGGLQGGDPHWDAIGSLLSVCDALGTTTNVKTPLFFSDPMVVRQLVKLEMAKQSGIGTELMKEYTEKIRDNLKELLFKYSETGQTDGVTSDPRLAGILNAIENNFNDATGQFFLGQIGARINPDDITIGDDLKPMIQVNVGDEYTLMSNTLGSRVATGGINKAMDDMGVDGRHRTSANIDRGVQSNDPRHKVFNGEFANFTIVNTPNARLTGENLIGAVEDVSAFSVRSDMHELREGLLNLTKDIFVRKGEAMGMNEDDSLRTFSETPFSSLSNTDSDNIFQTRNRLINAFKEAVLDKTPRTVFDQNAQDALDNFITRLSNAETYDQLKTILNDGYTTPMEQRFLDPENLQQDISTQDENILNRIGPQAFL